MTSIIDKIQKTFTSKENNYNYLLFFRVAVGLIALLELLSMRKGFNLFFSKDKTIIPQKLQFLFSEYFDYLNPIYTFLEKHNSLSLFYDFVFYTYIVSLLFLVIGLFTRFSAVIAVILQLIIFKSLAIFNFGYDHFLTMSLFYCIIFPVGKVNSIDNLIFKNNNQFSTPFNYQRIVQLHLTIVYVFGGIAKIVSITWWNGEAIWRAVSTVYDNYFKVPPIILAVVGIVTVLTETFYPLLIRYSKTKNFAIYSMISMHAFIAVVLELPFFAAIMIVWNITSYFELFYTQKTKTSTTTLNPVVNY